MNPNDNPNIIRITSEEVGSSHVDDLLKRQMSMRGDPGVTRGQSRRWYYQNWFVFSLFGMIAAFAAWAMLEPYFADMLYLQGPIEKLSTEGSIAEDYNLQQGEHHQRFAETGWVKIKGQKVWLLGRSELLRKDGRHLRLDPSDFKVGQEIGVYVEYIPIGQDEDLALAYYATTNTVKQSASRASLTLYQLHSRSRAASLLLFPLVAGMVGLAIGGIDGLICRLPRRAILSGFVGLLIGFVGGFVSGILADLIYAPLTALANHHTEGGGLTTLGFVLQMVGRSLAWAMAGMAMGLGQGIALRSKRLLLYGLIGGIVGGLLGGLLFDPIDLLLVGEHKPDAWISRMVSFSVVGGCVGAFIGIVELLARDAWLRMTQGPLAGKEFLLFKDVMQIGCSPRSDIYLFNDPLVAQDHAVLRTVGDECEIESRNRDQKVLLNSRPVQQGRLRHGDQVTIGRTVFVFQRRRG